MWEDISYTNYYIGVISRPRQLFLVFHQRWHFIFIVHFTLYVIHTFTTINFEIHGIWYHACLYLLPEDIIVKKNGRQYAISVVATPLVKLLANWIAIRDYIKTDYALHVIYRMKLTCTYVRLQGLFHSRYFILREHSVRILVVKIVRRHFYKSSNSKDVGKIMILAISSIRKISLWTLE